MPVEQFNLGLRGAILQLSAASAVTHSYPYMVGTPLRPSQPSHSEATLALSVFLPPG